MIKYVHMFDVESLCSDIQKAVNQLDNLLGRSVDNEPSSKDLKTVLKTAQLLDCVANKVASSYSNSQVWAADGYLSGKSAIVHETSLLRRNVESSLAMGKFLKQFPIAMTSIQANEVTPDHVVILIPLTSDKYIEFFNDDVELIFDAAKTLSAQQFSNVAKHWKSMVDSVIDEPTDEYKAFENRRLFLNELLDGSWFIHGELDPVTGKILHKALSSISQKLYNSSDVSTRSDYSATQQRADAIGYLAERYIEDASVSSTPLLNVDISIDVNELNPETTTYAYLKKCIKTDSPIVQAHSRKYLEQLLCDSNAQIPVLKQDGSFDLGRKVRTAPWRMKKQLMLKAQTCSVPGCCTPSTWCDAHHVKHWIHGGETKIENLALLCRRHHTMVHNDKTFEEKLSNWLNEKSPPLINTV